MRYRENRFPCRLRTRIVARGVDQLGFVLNVSRIGLMVELGTRLPMGANVTVSLANRDRETVVTRLDGSRYGLKFKHPLSQSDLRKLRSDARAGPRGSRFHSEL